MGSKSLAADFFYISQLVLKQREQSFLTSYVEACIQQSMPLKPAIIKLNAVLIKFQNESHVNWKITLA